MKILFNFSDYSNGETVFFFFVVVSFNNKSDIFFKPSLDYKHLIIDGPYIFQ